MAWIEKRQRQRHTAYKVYWRDLGGKVRTRSFTSSADARRFARDVEGRKDRGAYIDPKAGEITLDQLVGHCTETADLRPTTKAKYATLHRLYLTDGIGGQKINVITKGDVREFYAGLRKRGKGATAAEAAQGHVTIGPSDLVAPTRLWEPLTVEQSRGPLPRLFPRRALERSRRWKSRSRP